jgi:thioredoxin reductase (NADPH)
LVEQVANCISLNSFGKIMKNLTVAVIGSGPAGFTAGIYLGRALLKPVLFSGLNIGGQLMFTRDVENYPGFPDGMRGPEFMLSLQKQAAKFETEIRHEQITAVDLSKRPFRLWNSLPKDMEFGELKQLSKQDFLKTTELIKKDTEPAYSAESILISTGAEHIKLDIPGEKSYVGKGVGFCAVCDGAFYRDKKVFVVGGGDTALGDALALSKYTNQVFLLHRRDQFRASKILQKQVFADKHIKIFWNTEVKEIIGDEQRVTALKLIKEGKEEQVSADGIFIAIGYRPNSALFVNQVAIDDHSYILTRQFGSRQALNELLNKQEKNSDNYFPTMTSVPGVFAAGDVTDSRYRQAVVAAGSGAMAAIDIEEWLEMNTKS